MTTPEEDARADAKELWELIHKSLNTLMIAQAAGLVTCLTLLKDYKVESPGALKGVGIFVGLFGIGLFSGIAASLQLLSMRDQMIGPIASRASNFSAELWSLKISAATSVILLFVAIFLAIGKFGYL